MLLVNVNTKQFIPSAGSNFIQPIESRDQVIYGTRVEIRFQLYNPDGTVFALNESDVFCCAGDINFIHTDDLMFYAGHESCRIIDAAQGLVGVTIDATSDSFADKATSQNTRMYVQLKRHVAGDTLGDTVLQDIVYAQPAVMTTEGAPASSDPEYMTAAATLALLRTAPDFQFSVDGKSGWHDEQDIAVDRFYRERRNGGEWGPAIELIEGKAGEAAGFGAPSVAVESLPAGSNATASVTASGDDTAKEFNFNFGIPRGAAGADGVSSYTYVAYASDAAGAGFSLTPSNALQFRAEIHTTTAIETPDAADFAGATWVKYIGSDGGGAGDMLKSVYDTNDDGIVDHAAVADAVGATTAAQVADAVSKAHTHANKATLDKLAETDGKLTFDGSEIGGGSGTVKSVNGQLPDESGNVTVETGGAVDESRLLPENPVNGDIPCFDATATIGGGNDANTKILLHFDADEIKDEAAGNAAPVTVTEKSGTITIVNGGKWGKCAKFVTGSMAVATNLDELNANNWVVSGWFKPDADSHGVGNPTWLSMDDGSTNGFIFDSAGRYGEADGPLFYLDTPPASGTWHWLAIVKYLGGLRFYLNGTFLNEISAEQRAGFCSTLAIGGFAGTYNAGSTERTFSGLVDEVRLQYIPSGEINQWTGTSIAVPAAPYSTPQTVGEWGKLNKSALVQSVNGQTPNGSGAVTLPVATASAAGLMSAADKVKLNNHFTTMTTGTIDFNQLTDVGVYFVSGSYEHTNYPGSTAKVGGVLTVQGIGAYRAQSFAVFGSPNQSVTWTRWATSDGSSWTFQPWRKHLIDLDITESKTSPGYFKLPGGTIVQWGAANITNDGIYQVIFPLVFPNAIFIGNATAVSGTGNASGVLISISGPQTNRMNIVTRNHPGTDQNIIVHWLAIGY
nr:MAG TPA: Concanavalin A-like lectin/glucanase superfamily protein [Caudoviricetes sp.]